MTPPNTTPLNEEDRLGEILTAVFNEGMAYQVSSLKDYKDLNFMSVKTAKQELTNLIQTLEQKAELYGRLHETIEAFQAGAIDADAYSKRHATLTDEIAQLEKGSE